MAGMERNTGFNTTTTTKDLKHKSCCFMASHLMKKSNNNDNVKESSYYYGNNEDDGLMCWPPRCYTCSFCKREFKSAQALGGHMNVHRRDRAKLLMGHNSPPPPPPPPPTDKYRYSLQNLNLQPNSTNNPSPNISSSAPPPPSPSRKFSHYSSWGKGVVPNNDHLKSSSSTANDSFCMQEIFL